MPIRYPPRRRGVARGHVLACLAALVAPVGVVACVMGRPPAPRPVTVSIVEPDRGVTFRSDPKILRVDGLDEQIDPRIYCGREAGWEGCDPGIWRGAGRERPR